MSGSGIHPPRLQHLKANHSGLLFKLVVSMGHLTHLRICVPDRSEELDLDVYLSCAQDELKLSSVKI